uniref:Ubiquitin carboxyl-terminal hydrolase 9-like isoform X1 n=1 Tax=Tanacetum cinerariifolium TaxID=118510 RepID=A0A6L2NM86_TANCI|nr:ubiquitin carboxyl-terminal hydrolase 9-like isoform X1 [Tanacetum cinerariifolium]
MAFLMNGLHEDVNRVKQKPYFETKESDDRPDEEGQYKSTRLCIQFVTKSQSHLTLACTCHCHCLQRLPVNVFYEDGSGLPIPSTVNVSKHGCCKDLYQDLGIACCVGSDETLILAELESRWKEIFDTHGYLCRG